MEVDCAIPLHAAFPCTSVSSAHETVRSILTKRGCPDTKAVAILIHTVPPAVNDIKQIFRTTFTVPETILNDERASTCLVGLFSTKLNQVIFWGFKSLYWIKCQCNATAFEIKRLVITRTMCNAVDVTKLASRWVFSGNRVHTSFNWSAGDLSDKADSTLGDLAKLLSLRLELFQHVVHARQAMESKDRVKKSFLQALEEEKMTKEVRNLLCPTSKLEVLIEARSLYCCRMLWASLAPNSETRRELADRWRQLELDIFSVRSTGYAKQCLQQLVVDGKSVQCQSLHDMPAELQKQCRSLDPICEQWFVMPFESALRATAHHHSILCKGNAYIPSNSIQELARERYSHWLTRLVDVRDMAYRDVAELIRGDKRLMSILREHAGKFHRAMAPSVRSNSNIPSQDLHSLSAAAKKKDSWMPPCMQQFALQKHLKNEARLTYAQYLFRRGASMGQVRQHFLPKFEHAYPPQQFVKEWKTIKGEIDWNFKHRMRNEATCDKMMACGNCPLRAGGTTALQARIQCAGLAKERTKSKNTGHLTIRAPRDFSVFVLSA